MQLKKKYLLIPLAFVIVTVASCCVAYWIALSSDAYQTARVAAEKMAASEGAIGEIIDTRLSFLGHAIQYKGPNGTASFDIAVEGRSGNAKVRVHLEDTTGTWAIKSATLRKDQ